VNVRILDALQLRGRISSCDVARALGITEKGGLVHAAPHSDGNGHRACPSGRLVPRDRLKLTKLFIDGKIAQHAPQQVACENFWSLLKRGLRGTYVAAEPFRLNPLLQ
jgi:hypothetical protein